MAAGMIDVEKHLQEEAAEDQWVMREIEEQIGFHGSPLQIEEQVGRWLGGNHAGGGVEVQLPATAAVGEAIGWVVAGIVAEAVLEAVFHVATGGATLAVSGVMA